jgi:type VI secretion system secreted protein VgrG
MARAITVSSPLGPDKFIVRRLTGTEELGRLFEFQLELYSEDHAVQATDLLGQGLTVTVEWADGRKRYFHGYACEFCQTSAQFDESGEQFAKYAGYRVVLRPQLWFLTRTADCRIFQQQAIPDILTTVFNGAALSDVQKSLSGTYNAWDYCTQYDETKFNFVSRLMEHEGIYYYCTHADGKHTLVLADSVSAHSDLVNDAGTADLPLRPPKDIYDSDRVFDWQVTHQVQAGTYKHTDFDFEQPSANLLASNTITRTHQKADGEIFYYPGKYRTAANGQTYATTRIQECQAQYELVRATTNAALFTVGNLFNLTDSARSEQNRQYLVTATAYDLVQELDIATGKTDDSDWGPKLECRFTAISSDQVFRPARVTPKSVVRGPHTAIVVGKAGEEIWTDKYGRVKVKFHWDRLSQSDENSSCWVRVAQVWAGKQWGAIHIPRIGQEVIVDFLEGDPDQPIITGRVYNAEQMPPYTLPDNMTQSGLKSRSTKQGDATTFNELRFEDKKDSEEIYFHAEKNFNRVVENNDTLKVGFEKKADGNQTIEIRNNQKLVVGSNDADGNAPPDGSQTTEIWNKQTLVVGKGEANAADGSQTIEIWKDRTETVKEGNEKVTIAKGNRDVIVSKGNDTHTVSEGNRVVTVSKGNDTHTVSQGNREVKIDQGNDTLTITQGDQSITITAGKSTIEAGTSIELKVGGSSIKIEAAKITIKSPEIAIQADAQLKAQAPMSEVSGDATLTLKGGIVKIN